MTLPTEVTLATDCAAALDRGDKKAAKRLAEAGLRISSDSPTWTRRFQHLLRIATGASIEGPPYEPPTCSFCLEQATHVVAGVRTYICDGCVDRCSSAQLDGSVLRRVAADDIVCSFCGQKSAEPLFGGGEYFICTSCIARCLEIRGS